nr:unnamed protein product [Callosobruchus analis]
MASGNGSGSESSDSEDISRKYLIKRLKKMERKMKRLKNRDRKEQTRQRRSRSRARRERSINAASCNSSGEAPSLPGPPSGGLGAERVAGGTEGNAQRRAPALVAVAASTTAANRLMGMVSEHGLKLTVTVLCAKRRCSAAVEVLGDSDGEGNSRKRAHRHGKRARSEADSDRSLRETALLSGHQGSKVDRYRNETASHSAPHHSAVDRSPRETATIENPGTSSDRSLRETTRNTVPETVAEGEAETAIPTEYLNCLGEDPKTKQPTGSTLHVALVTRWEHILTTGLEVSEKTQLLEKYGLPSNCEALTPPSLHKKRDENYLILQAQLNKGIVALGKGLETVLAEADTSNKENLLTHLGDAGRILCDLSFLISKTRRFLIEPSLSKTAKDMANKNAPLGLLFRDNLQEKVNEAKMLEKTSLALKPNKPSVSSKSCAKQPQQRAHRRDVEGGRRPTTSRYEPYQLNRRRPAHQRGEMRPQKGPPKTQPIANHDVSNREHCSFGTFNSHRAALSLLLGEDVGKDRTLSRFMKGISNMRPSLPRYNYTWDPQQVLEYLRHLGENSQLSLKELSGKVATLLALLTGNRIQTIALIRVSNINESKDGIQILITEKIKTSGRNRVQPCLQLPYYKNDARLCPVLNLKCYITMTQSLRDGEDFVFISHQRPYRRVTKNSISRWIKDTLRKAGINTEIFKPHSTRHAATSAALKKGVQVETILKAAGWTQANTFARFYHRRVVDQSAFATALLQEEDRNPVEGS